MLRTSSTFTLWANGLLNDFAPLSAAGESLRTLPTTIFWPIKATSRLSSSLRSKCVTTLKRNKSQKPSSKC